MVQKSLFGVVGGAYRNDLACTACPLGLDPRLKSNCMQGIGEKEPLLMFVGVSPGWEDDSQGIPWTGPTGNMFREILVDAGIKFSETFFTNAVRCATDGDPKPSHFQKCREHLIREIKEVRPKALIAIGGAASTQLIGKATNKIRKKEFACTIVPGLKVYAIPQPAILFHQEGISKERAREELVEDLAWIKQQVQSGGNKVLRPQDYRIARTLEEVDAFLAECTQEQAVAFDFETNFLGRPYPELGHHIAALGLSKGQGHARIIPIHMKAIKTPLWWSEKIEAEVKKRVRAYLSKQLLYGHNAYSYDTIVARVLLGVEQLRLDFDTMLGQYCLDEEPPHELEHVALRYTPFDKLWKDKFNLDDPGELSKYLFMDVDATSQIRAAVSPQLLAEPDLNQLLGSILLPTGKVLTDIQCRGIKVDTDFNKLLAAGVTEKQAAITESIRRLEAVAQWELSRNRYFNPASASQVGDIMENVLKLPKIKATAGGGYATDDQVLEKYKEHEFCGLVLQFRSLNKLLNTFISGIAERVSPTGLIHTNYRIITKTGRGSSSDPNLQQLPRETPDTEFKIKRQFIPRTGNRRFVAWDYSQAELRVWASLSGDEKLIQAYKSGVDFHTATAADAYEKDIKAVTKEERTDAKCFHPDTEVLTKQGWKRIADLSMEDEVAQAHPGKNYSVGMSWTKPTALQRLKHPAGKLLHLENKGIDLRVTPDHRMLGWTCRGYFDTGTPQDLSNERFRGWASAGIISGSFWAGYHPSEAVLRLMVAVQADGSITTNSAAILGFSKERKAVRLRTLLAEAGVKYRESQHSNGANKPTTSFYINAEESKEVRDLLDGKVLSWRLLGLPEHLREVVLEEAAFWDSHKHKNGRRYFYSSVVRQNAEVLQALASITGRKSRLIRHERSHENPKWSDSWRLSIGDHNHCRAGNITIEELDYTDEVVCLSVPSTYVLVRDRGVPVITGQCVNFGVIYGKQEDTLVRDFVDTAEANARKAGRKLTRAERNAAEMRARKFFRKHQDTFKDGWKWLNAQAEIAAQAGTQVLPSGRRRRHRKSDHSAQREAMNFPVQSLANEVCFAALRELDAKLSSIEGANANLVLTVHDSIVAECELEYLFPVAQMGYDVMTGIKFDWMKVPMEVDVEAGLNYGELKKLDLKTRTVKD